MALLPLHLQVEGRAVLVVGDGPVGRRRAQLLRGAGADVTVVALPRAFVPADLDGMWLVLTCTGTIDDQVAALCEQRRIWCVRADDAARSAAWVPAVARAEDVVVSVTAGGDPRRSVALRDAIAASLAAGELPTARHRP